MFTICSLTSFLFRKMFTRITRLPLNPSGLFNSLHFENIPTVWQPWVECREEGGASGRGPEGCQC